MPASKLLNHWIAESGSWQAFLDFHLPKDAMAEYDFFSKPDDFFLSLMSRAFELIKEKPGIKNIDEILSVAKGLEIFSLKIKKDYFKGINPSNNVLFAAGLYYLSEYSASAWILANIYPQQDYYGESDLFISNFLKRKLKEDNLFDSLLKEYLQSGDAATLSALISKIQELKSVAFLEDAEEYISLTLAEVIILKFKKDNIWDDLLKVNPNPEHWKAYVNQSIIKKVPVWSFFPSQKQAIQKGVLNGSTCSLQMPTSAGKTSISELIIYDEFKKNRNCKILYLAPFRALASELKMSLAISLSNLGIKSKTIYGGNLPTIEERTSISEINLLIATPEKFMAIEDVFPGMYKEFTTIICDEGHLLDDSSRGLSYELLLSRLKNNSETSRRFIFISAIIPNISIVNNWLGGSEETVITSQYRPTELEYGFLHKMKGANTAYLLDINPQKNKPYNYQLYKFLSTEDLTIINKETGKTKSIITKKGISVAVSLKATESGTVALFAPEKRGNFGVEVLVNEAIEQLVNKETFTLRSYSPSDFLESLAEFFTIVFGSNYLLTQSSQLGVLFHHGDFPQGIREIIEEALRSGYIRLVICTNTLAEGVNLPIKTMVLHSTTRFNPDSFSKREPIKIRDLKNLVGRAGRAGKETKGLVIIPHLEDFKTVLNLIKEVNVEPVKGELYNIINLITNALQRQRLQLTSQILDSLNEYYQKLLDSIDIAMIDLLAEEIESEKLNVLVKELITQTLSFYQANGQEKQTLNKLFELRAEKIKPIINSGSFKILKNSGTSIRQYNEIITHFDFDNIVWIKTTDPFDKEWLNYILDNGIFKLKSFMANLVSFNHENKCDLNTDDIKNIILEWTKGEWFDTISEAHSLQIYQTLRLINSVISFNLQSTISTIIRIKELNSKNYALPDCIRAFPSLIQHGVNSQRELDIIEMGLIDRVAVIAIGDYLDNIKYKYTDYKTLKEFLVSNAVELIDYVDEILPRISSSKTQQFIERLQIPNIL